MLKLKVTSLGSSTGMVLPKEALARLKVAKGDFVFFDRIGRRFPYHAI